MIHGIDLIVEDGELAVLVGPSGCGKTTTLRMIAGLETVSGGAILFDGELVAHLEPKDRDIAMVFQSYALYPHMTVRGNLAFSLKMKGVPRAEREGLVRRAAEMLGIDGLLDRKPRELSGGQRQRVAMGRALVREPRAFLLDEPLSNLDAALRAQMRIELKRIHQRLETTIVYVTHDQIEAMTLADRIVVMRDGRIEQVGDPMSVYQVPVNKFVAGFIGSPRMNFIPAHLFDDLGTLKARLPSGEALRLPADRAAAYRSLIGAPVELGIRPEHLTDRAEPAGDDSQVFEGVVDVVEPMGATCTHHSARRRRLQRHRRGWAGTPARRAVAPVGTAAPYAPDRQPDRAGSAGVAGLGGAARALAEGRRLTRKETQLVIDHRTYTMHPRSLESGSSFTRPMRCPSSSGIWAISSASFRPRSARSIRWCTSGASTIWRTGHAAGLPWRRIGLGRVPETQRGARRADAPGEQDHRADQLLAHQVTQALTIGELRAE